MYCKQNIDVCIDIYTLQLESSSAYIRGISYIRDSSISSG